MTSFAPALLGAARSLAATIRRHPSSAIAAAIVVVLILAALLADYIAPHDPMAISGRQRLRPPSEANPMGTDNLGRDVLSRVIHGAQISLLVGISVAAVSTVVGSAIGVLAGYSRYVDLVVMRIMDGLMAIPGILLAIAFLAMFGSSVTSVIIAISVPDIPRVVRLVRSVVLSLRELLYVESARSMGAGPIRIILRHILPNAAAPILVQASFLCASAILAEASLGFLGLGTPSEIPSWGNIIAEGRSFIGSAPWLLFFPALALTVTVLAVNVLGDGLRDALDPRFRRRI
ncbi:peptide ABC transporter permease [Bosea sp. Root381]|uniref:ABC transporter permease n=1 Tax=Bosea sp. Root381 TaxID=1736524 RepID=UPI0006F46948|nr:ABC transporter permease [Bosea sp. Root381]KRE07981.1 peptide ABC transporter permease [Bosea sp. Root381]